MSDCLFCKMVTREIEPDIVYETETILAFRDINAQAPTHILIIPKRHIRTINDLQSEDSGIIGELFLAARDIAKKMNVASAGYRVVMNCNASAGQTVFHVHLHLLGGRSMGWPPG